MDITQLLPNLKEPSLIIMDNAPYHSWLFQKMPTTTWKKADIQKWLKENDIPFSESDYRVDLLNLVKQHNKPKRYVVDEFLNTHGLRTTDTLTR